jgi:hypothetical protein
MTNIEQLMEKYDIWSLQKDWCDKFLNELKSLQSIEQPNVKELWEKIDRESEWTWRYEVFKENIEHLTSKAPKQEVKVDKVEWWYANDWQYIKINYYCMSCWAHITNRMWCPNHNCSWKQVLC